MNYSACVKNIKSKFTNEELKDLDLIIDFDSLQLASMGANDTEGYQIFTPKFIVKDMCKAIGENEIFDSSKTVLEPTSGDGAFTTYILFNRLEKAYKSHKEDIELESLKALSTIYSNEMDRELIVKQRSNILTVFKEFAGKKRIKWSQDYLELVKCIILKNFTWGMFNSEYPIGEGLLLGVDVVYKMPEAEKKELVAIEFPVWEITSDTVDYHMEGVDL